VDEPLAKRRMHKESWSFDKKDLYYGERIVLFNKLKSLYPEINEEFGYELKLMEGRISHSEAISCWMKGQRRKARRLLLPFLMIEKKFFLPYLLSYLLSYRLYTSLLKMCGKYVYVP
jgi:hypothetical protein